MSAGILKNTEVDDFFASCGVKEAKVAGTFTIFSENNTTELNEMEMGVVIDFIEKFKTNFPEKKLQYHKQLVTRGNTGKYWRIKIFQL